MLNHLLVSIPKAMEVACILLAIGCPAFAVLFPKRKKDSIFSHYVL